MGPASLTGLGIKHPCRQTSLPWRVREHVSSGARKRATARVRSPFLSLDTSKLKEGKANCDQPSVILPCSSWGKIWRQCKCVRKRPKHTQTLSPVEPKGAHKCIHPGSMSPRSLVCGLQTSHKSQVLTLRLHGKGKQTIFKVCSQV